MDGAYYHQFPQSVCELFDASDDQRLQVYTLACGEGATQHALLLSLYYFCMSRVHHFSPHDMNSATNSAGVRDIMYSV